jgi:integrase
MVSRGNYWRMNLVAMPVAINLEPVASNDQSASTVQHNAIQPEVIHVLPEPAPKAEASPRFKHGGRSYKLFKRKKTRDGNYFIKFEYRGKQYFKGLETNAAPAAIARAKTYLDAIRNEKWQDAERMKARSNFATFSEIEPLYRKFALIGSRTIENNLWAMGKLLNTALGITDWKTVSLAALTPMLVAKFQTAMVEAYCIEMGKDEEQQRQARELALRSSKSIINQARSLFNKDKSLLAQYVHAGLRVPDCIKEFMGCKVLGKIAKGEYLAPPDHVVEKAFTEIGKLKECDRNAYIAFWLAAGAGLRRSEIQRCRWEFWIERDGMVWISGGLGKDGKRIEVPMQQRAVEALSSLRKPEGRVMSEEMGKEFAKRLNYWMKQQGWNTAKKMHELRAYVGSLIYRVNPQAAMKFMRHKSIRITEQFYVRYGHESSVPNVL